jgi:tetratricopeptide (TPR) repeat protein
MPDTFDKLTAFTEVQGRMHARTLPLEESGDEHPAIVGRTLSGRYLVEREVGRGGMGQVFAARDLKLERAVAVKFLARGCRDARQLARIEREARAVGALNHPNIVALYDLATEDDEPFITFELLEGDSLRRRLATPLPIATVLDLALQLARGLGAAHLQGLVHLDLKPENLFITSDGRLKILDFGIARLTAAATDATGPIFGTLGYMSPEQIQGEPTDHRADIFSFGAVLFEMCCGRPAFPGETPSVVGEASLSGEPGALPDIVPLRLDRLIRRCLGKRPRERPPAVLEVIAELERVAVEVAAPASTEKAAAYDWYLRGRYHFLRRPTDIEKAIAAFEQAVHLDAACAPAYAGLADCYANQGSWENGSAPPAQAMPEARRMAERALAIDRTLAAPHASLGYVALHYDWDFATAEAAFQEALRLDPSNVNALHWRSHLLVAQGRFEESLAESERALQLSPLDRVLIAHLGWHFFQARQYDAAVDVQTRELQLFPEYGMALALRGFAEERRHARESAIRDLRHAARVQGSTWVQAALAFSHARHGNPDEARRILGALEAVSAERYVAAFDLALIHAGLDEPDQAFARLRQALAERSPWIAYLPIDPRLDELRADPRFAELLASATSSRGGA